MNILFTPGSTKSSEMPGLYKGCDGGAGGGLTSVENLNLKSC